MTAVFQVWYTMHCENCPAGVSFQPMKDGIRSRSVAVRGLIPDTTYHFRIYSNNRVSTRLVSNELNSALSFATFNYTTPAAGMHFVCFLFILKNLILKLDIQKIPVNRKTKFFSKISEFEKIYLCFKVLYDKTEKWLDFCK